MLDRLSDNCERIMSELHSNWVELMELVDLIPQDRGLDCDVIHIYARVLDFQNEGS